MRRNILVIGENDWPKTIDDNIDIYCFKNPNDVNLYSDESETLYFLSNYNTWEQVSYVFWRCQFFDNYAVEHKILDLIAFTKTRCINMAETNIRYGHNIAMFNAMRECKLPIITRRFAIGKKSTSYIQPQHTIEVFKVGDYHRGYAKSIIRDKETFQDTIDMAWCMNDIQSLEPYVDYARDIRILKIGNSLTTYEREPSIWKSNVCPLMVSEVLINSIPNEIVEYSNRLANYINADILGIDWIQDKSNRWFALEANLSPGLEKNIDYERIIALL